MRAPLRAPGDAPRSPDGAQRHPGQGRAAHAAAPRAVRPVCLDQFSPTQNFERGRLCLSTTRRAGGDMRKARSSGRRLKRDAVPITMPTKTRSMRSCGANAGRGTGPRTRHAESDTPRTLTCDARHARALAATGALTRRKSPNNGGSIGSSIPRLRENSAFDPPTACRGTNTRPCWRARVGSAPCARRNPIVRFASITATRPAWSAASSVTRAI
jgi:hypothetical protein